MQYNNFNIEIPDRINRGGLWSENSVKCKYPEFYNFLINNYKDLPWIEKLYWYKHNLSQHPLCKHCGKSISKFINYNEGYRLFCSHKCSRESEYVKNKISMSNKSNFNDSVKKVEIINKIKQTCLERYGVEDPSKLKGIQEKKKTTCLERYGVENPFQSEKIKNKIKQTCLERYGEIHAMKNSNIRDKFETTMLTKYNVKHALQQDIYTTLLSPVEDQNNFLKRRKCPHKDCNFCNEKFYEIHDSLYHDRKQYNIELCTRLNPYQFNYAQNSHIESFIRKILTDLKIEYQNNVKNIISPYELDIYIPSKQLAIECNGVYWHSSEHKSQNYHYNKYNLCKQMGIRLISIWEDQLVKNKQSIKRLINSLFIINNVKSNITIKQITFKCYNKFLNTNHLFYNNQEQSSMLDYIGIYDSSELIAVFGLSRIIDGDLYILKCHKYFSNIGDKECIQYIVDKYSPNNIIYESHNDIQDNIISDYDEYELYQYIEPFYIKKDSKLERYLYEDDNKYFEIFDSGVKKININIKKH